MERKFRKIDAAIWCDANFAAMTHLGQLAFLYLLTHPSSTSVGGFMATTTGLAAELGCDETEMIAALAPMIDSGSLVIDPRRPLVYLRRFTEYNPPKTEKHVAGWAAVLVRLPECETRDLITADLEAAAEAAGDKVHRAFKELVLGVKTRARASKTTKPADDAKDQNKPTKTRKKTLPVTAEQVVELYHETLPEHPRCLKLTAKRRSQIDARTREDLAGEDSAERWAKYFAYVGKSAFLSGRVAPKDEGRPFMADLEWLTSAGNFAKVAEGKYHA